MPDVKVEDEKKAESENMSSENEKKIEFYYYDENLVPIFRTKVIHKDKPIIEIFPFSVSRIRGLSPQKISTLEFRGWNKIKDLPGDFRYGNKVRPTGKRAKLFMDYIKRTFPEVSKIVITKINQTRFTKKTITFNWADLNKILITLKHEIESFDERKKLTANNALSEITSKIKPQKTKLKAGNISRFLSLHDDVAVSEQDLDSIMPIIQMAPKGQILVTDNFIKTRDKINVAYLSEVIEIFKTLMKVRTKNEKDWQSFFADHGWILNHLFAFPVILYQKEAYLGGKTLKNDNGRYIDFLFQNGFKDNYALLEIKTHNTKLLNAKPYREPSAFSMHSELSGAISQAIDQKHIFQVENGKNYPTLDPKVVLIVGQKSLLSDNQKECLELLRNNQKNVEIVTFDELLQKIETLVSTLSS